MGKPYRDFAQPKRLIVALIMLALLAACGVTEQPQEDSTYIEAQGLDLNPVWAVQGCEGTPNDIPSQRHEKGCFGKILQWPDGSYAWNRPGDPTNKAIMPIHATLLPSGKVLTFGPGDSTYSAVEDPDYASAHNKNSTDIWDPITNTHTLVNNTQTELFCAGHAALPDGRTFVAGGHLGKKDGKYLGTTTVNLFDSLTNTWTLLDTPMYVPRWYPSVTALANGEMMIIGGINYGQDFDQIEVWRVEGNTATKRLLAVPKLNRAHPQYPWLTVTSSGKVFVSGQENKLGYFDPTGDGRWEDLGGRGARSRDGMVRNSGTSVMYAKDKFLVAGGSPGDGDTDLPVNSAVVIDLNQPPGQEVRPISPMKNPRRHHNATILPDGTVWVNGGTKGPGVNNQALENRVYESELWNPITEQWNPTAVAQKFRSYHSTSLLLPDGRVMTGGGGRCDGCNPQDDNTDVEVYWPPYLFNPDGSLVTQRPEITRYPTQVRYGQRFSVRVQNAGDIRKVTWLRLGSVTHSVNFDQRINYLDFSNTFRSTGFLYIKAPENPNLAPPGFYMLFLVDGKGVPSIGRIIQIR